jgi:hypothetical protein
LGATHLLGSPVADSFRNNAGGAAVVVILAFYLLDFICPSLKKEEKLMDKINYYLGFARIVAPVVATAQHISYYGCFLWLWITSSGTIFNN